MLKYNKQKKQGKVRNATANVYNGIKFKSKFETYTFKTLTEANIHVEYEVKRYTILPKFKFGDENIRPITYLPDFVGDGFIIECKGFPNDAWPLRKKLMMYYLATNEPDIQFYIVKNKKDIQDLIQHLKSIN